MKLRILGDSLRLRLSQGEVAAFAKDGRIAETVRFGPSGRVIYALEHAEDVATMHASFEGTVEHASVVVRLPSTVARAWAGGEEISLRADQGLDGDDVLSLLVEKDFKCVVPRPGEEQYDGFPHPTGKC